MSDDAHGHDAGHGHDASDEVGEIIKPGSWQDNLLALVAIFALGGLTFWGAGYAQGIKVVTPHHEAGHEAATHSAGEAHGAAENGTHGAGEAQEHTSTPVESIDTHDAGAALHPEAGSNQPLGDAGNEPGEHDTGDTETTPASSSGTAPSSPNHGAATSPATGEHANPANPDAGVTVPSGEKQGANPNSQGDIH